MGAQTREMNDFAAEFERVSGFLRVEVEGVVPKLFPRKQKSHIVFIVMKKKALN
ncbi:hypothetical protein J2R99_001117 [Rhodopseudomonas julia]|uniref:Uncharacterized protein n=1 Tax=Rhodopseudomonas julia TaxID=200617 RepID=A0ABU0C519_9BRAD|nr:hypothetical protein [Rhodopseudomonas julia]MDQ0325268.1 hypothetical protein [Rhodopseudomonas julia]